MILTGNVRLGRDVELKYTGSNTAVANLAGVYEYGRKGDDGKKPSQWIDAALFGKQAEAMAPYLKKGTVVSVTLDDVHLESYQGKTGTVSKLCGKVINIGFAPSQPKGETVQPAARSSGGNLSDDIPFATVGYYEA